MPKISGLHLSWTGAVIGSVLLIAGVWLAFSVAYGLITTGCILITASLLFIDTEDKKERPK